MSARVLLATSANPSASAADDSPLVEALDQLGVPAAWAEWDDPSAGFDRADLVVLRSTWDYPLRREEFLSWCDSVPALANPARVARWNTDKTYLADLAAHGVAVVPTALLEPGQPITRAALAEWPGREFVLKPSVGAGSRGAARFGPDDLEPAAAHLADLHADGQIALAQPYQRFVDREGETALVFLGGVFSHAFVKGPMLRDEPGELGAGERLRITPDAPLRRAAEDAVDAAAEVHGLRRADLLYARVDLVRRDDGVPLVLELEVTEPSLGFGHADADAPLRFASAVRAALSGAGR